MFDLRQKRLPDSITVGGEDYKIETGFRAWLGFADMIRDRVKFEELLPYFADEIPPINLWQEAYEQLVMFFLNPAPTPSTDGEDGNDKIIDYVLDGDYIYGSFYQAYGIDLMSAELHWWQFLALFRSLPESCKISWIMATRAYTTPKANADQDEVYKKAKKA